MEELDVAVDELIFEAGRLSLTFANTVEWHASEQPTEYLNSYADLVRWAEEVKLLTGDRAEQLSQEGLHRSEEANKVLEKAIELREVIYRIFSAVAAEQSVEPDDLDILNKALSESLIWLRVTQTGDGFSWAWSVDETTLDQMLWPIARSGAKLLTSEELDRVRKCADDRGCGYLFIDMSRNRSRKWCDMRGCGNRAKVRRYRRKHGDE